MSTVFELNLDNSIINPIYIAPNLPECRICLENEGELINICGCSGTAEFVHKECIENWVNRFPKDHPNHYKCQICNEKYNLQLLDENQVNEITRSILYLLYFFFILCGFTIIILLIGML